MVTPPDEDLSRLLAFPPAPPGPAAPHELLALRSPAAIGSPIAYGCLRCDSVPHIRSCGIDLRT